MAVWSSSVGLIILLLFSVAFFSLFERKVMASMQSRKGPSKVLCFGFFQPFADALKLLTKVETSPTGSAMTMYAAAPSGIMLISLLVWIICPVSFGFFFSEWGMLLLATYFSIFVYGLVLSGWSSNSRYATLGSVRAISQSISFEVGLSLLFIFVMVIFASFDILDLVHMQEGVWTSFLFPPLFFCSLVCFLAETSRSPFDLPEGESELVSGYSVEYGGGKYTIIFLGENLSLLWASKVISFCFLGSNAFLFIMFFFVWVRATVPRVRYDKITKLFWLSILPLILCFGGILILL